LNCEKAPSEGVKGSDMKAFRRQVEYIGTDRSVSHGGGGTNPSELSDNSVKIRISEIFHWKFAKMGIQYN
jgi:hypothetical protein